MDQDTQVGENLQTSEGPDYSECSQRVERGVRLLCCLFSCNYRNITSNDDGEVHKIEVVSEVGFSRENETKAKDFDDCFHCVQAEKDVLRREYLLGRIRV
jgi:hypothetical protein